MALHDDGGYASNVGRPLGEIFVKPAYGVSFFNKMIDSPLSAIGLVSEVPSLYEYSEGLGDTNLQYSRIFHFSVTDGSTGNPLQDEIYVPYINQISVSGSKTVISTKPLVEVMNPRFVQLSENIFVMYFFSSFTSAELPDGNTYNDDPKYLRRMVEFSTNEPDQIAGNTPSGLSEPFPNNRNYYESDVPEDDTPRTAFLSALLRVFPAKSSGEHKMYVIAERPIIITWVGHRFSLDTHPPLLVNQTQSVEWATDKDASDDLDDDAVNAEPPRQIPYHHVVSQIQSVMYFGYSGIDFYTQPINNLYDQALDHMFEINGSASKEFNIDDQHRRLKSIGIVQKDETSLGGSNFYPFERHFAVVQIDMDDFRPFGSSTTSFPSYIVEMPSGLNVKGDDKPEVWSYYWQECDSSETEIEISFEGDGVWYGTECVDGVEMFARLEERPYGYFAAERSRFWLTIGLLTEDSIEFDIVWQGYKVSGTDGDGTYNRYYALGDGTSETVSVSTA